MILEISLLGNITGLISDKVHAVTNAIHTTISNIETITTAITGGTVILLVFLIFISIVIPLFYAGFKIIYKMFKIFIYPIIAIKNAKENAKKKVKETVNTTKNKVKSKAAEMIKSFTNRIVEEVKDMIMLFIQIFPFVGNIISFMLIVMNVLKVIFKPIKDTIIKILKIKRKTQEKIEIVKSRINQLKLVQYIKKRRELEIQRQEEMLLQEEMFLQQQVQEQEEQKANEKEKNYINELNKDNSRFISRRW